MHFEIEHAIHPSVNRKDGDLNSEPLILSVLRSVMTPATKLRKLNALAPPKTPDMFWHVLTFFVFFIIMATNVILILTSL